MDLLLQLLFPLEDTSFGVIVASILNIMVIIVGTIFFSYFIELTIKLQKPRRPEFSKFTIITLAVTVMTVVLLAMLYSHTTYAENQGYSPNSLVRFLDPIVGVRSFSSVPFGAFGPNLILRYILVLALAVAVRLGFVFLNSSRKAFASFLDIIDKYVKDKAELKPDLEKEIKEGIDRIKSEGKSISVWGALGRFFGLFFKNLTPFKFLLLLLGGLSFVAFVFGSENPGDQISFLATSVISIFEYLLPLGMFTPPLSEYEGISFLLSNFAVTLLIIFIAFIYIAIAVALRIFVKKFWEIVKDINWNKSHFIVISNIFITVIVATLCAIGVFFFINSHEGFIEYFNIIDLSYYNVFVRLLMIVLIIAAAFVLLGLSILSLTVLVGFLFCIVCYAWHTVKKTLEHIKNNATEARLKRNGILALFGYLIKGIFQFISDTLTSILSIFVKASAKTRSVMAHTALGLFAVASFFNTLMGFIYFYMPEGASESTNAVPRVMYWLVTIAISVALQVAIVVFGLRAGEIWESRKYKKNIERNAKNIYLVPYILFLIISVSFAYTNIFSRLTDTARIRNTLFNDVRAETDRILDVRNRANNVQTTYSDTRTELANFLRRDARESVRRHAIALSYVSHLEEIESHTIDSAGNRAWHRQNERDRFRVNTQGLDNIVYHIVRLIYSDYDTFGRRAIYITEYHHFWRGNVLQAYTSRSFAYYVNEIRFTIGGVFDQPHPLRPEATDEERAGFIATAGWDAFIPSGRMMGSGSDHSAEVGVSDIMPHATKYQLIIELFGLYIAMANRIDDVYYRVPHTFRVANNLSPRSASGTHRINDNDEMWVALDRLQLVDSVRGTLATIYRRIIGTPIQEYETEPLTQAYDIDYPTQAYDNGSIYINQQLNTSSDIIPMADLSRILEVILTQALENPNDDTELNIEMLHNYVEESIRIYHILAVLENDNPNGETHNTHTVRAFRDYARSVSNSDFLLSYDILFRGHVRLNPHKNYLNSIYSASILAIVFLTICIIKDIAAFFVGKKNFHNKAIYSFEPKENEMLLKMGYFKFEEQLSAFFDMPSCDLGNYDSKELYLHRMLIYDILNDQGTVADCPREQSKIAKSRLCYRQKYRKLKNNSPAYNKNTATEDLFNDRELTNSYASYKAVRYKQLEHVFNIDMKNPKEESLLRTWLGSYTKGL